MKTKTRIKIVMLLFTGLTIFFAQSQPKSSEMNARETAQLYHSLAEHMQEFASKNRLSMSEVLKMATRLNTEDVFISKGSVGIIRSGLYVGTSTNNNKIMLNDANWHDLSFKIGSRQLVIVEQEKIIADLALKAAEESDL